METPLRLDDFWGTNAQSLPVCTPSSQARDLYFAPKSSRLKSSAPTSLISYFLEHLQRVGRKDTDVSRPLPPPRPYTPDRDSEPTDRRCCGNYRKAVAPACKQGGLPVGGGRRAGPGEEREGCGGWTAGEEDTLRNRRLSPQTEPVWTDKLTGTGGPSEHPSAHSRPLDILEAHLLTRGGRRARGLWGVTSNAVARPLHGSPVWDIPFILPSFRGILNTICYVFIYYCLSPSTKGFRRPVRVLTPTQSVPIRLLFGKK